MRTLCLLDSPDHVAQHGSENAGAISGIYRIAIAREPWEILGYGGLRRAVFCQEQKLFDGSDLDEVDRHAIPIVALSYAAGMAVDVVGAVRIHEPEPGTWIGSRLAVDQDWRGLRLLGSQLIRAAVCTAQRRGCREFLANVQQQNVPLFRRLHWRTIGETVVCGLPHHRMQADLEFYPADDPLAFQIATATRHPAEQPARIEREAGA